MKRSRGQSLVEYLILTCLLAVSSIAVVSVVSQNIRARYENISAALRGKKGAEVLVAPKRSATQVRGLEDFSESALKAD